MPASADEDVAPRQGRAQTVSAVVYAIERTLYQGLGDLAVEGEVSSLKRWRNGYWYFDLKDARSILPCVMREQHQGRLGFELKDGQHVVAYGRIGLYRQHCKNQLQVRRIEALGQGRLLEALERLKQKLLDEGLFEPERKRPLPALPRTVGVVTSPQGAVLHDVIKVIRGRTHGVSILLSPTRVQGEGASKDIAAALERLDRTRRCDVIIVGRGGGSLEDLMPFNMEVVVRAIANATTPIISSVGHQTDTTLADLAADVRAATPSHAAELAVSHRTELVRGLDGLHRRIENAIHRRQQAERYRLEKLARGLGDPRLQLYEARERLDTAARRLQFLVDERRADVQHSLRALTRRLEQGSPSRRLYRRREHVHALARRLEGARPDVDITRAKAKLAELEQRLRTAAGARRQSAGLRLGAAVSGLEALSPLAVLRRGYTLVTADDGSVRSRVRDVEVGEALTVRFDDGALGVEVKTRIVLPTVDDTPPQES